jgi:tripartite-type tricarboxylate transporter receptor subunit TctC
VSAQSLPEVPTSRRRHTDLVLESWYGAFVPAGTPTAVIGYLNAEMARAMADVATRDSLLQTATEPVGGSAEEFGRVVRADSAKYARLAKELGIKIN